MRVVNRGGFANPDVLCVADAVGRRWAVKDYAACRGAVRSLLAPGLIGHELRMLARLRGLPGVPGLAFRIDRLAFAMEWIDATPLERRSHALSLPPSFFAALEGILEGLALRGVVPLDLRSASNVLCTRSEAPALIDLGAALRLPFARVLGRWVARSALAKHRARYERRDDEPAPVVAGFAHAQLDLGRVRVRYLERGPLTDPVPLVCLHDLGLAGAMFGRWLESAEQAGRRVLAPDMPGFGGSRGPRRRLSAQAQAEHVLAWLAALRVARFDLVGVGWGAEVGERIVRRVPERVRAGLALDPGPSLPDPAKQGEGAREALLRGLPVDLEDPWRGQVVAELASLPLGVLRAALRPSGPPPSIEHLRRFARVPRSDPPAVSWARPLAEPDRLWRELARASS